MATAFVPFVDSASCSANGKTFAETKEQTYICYSQVARTIFSLEIQTHARCRCRPERKLQELWAQNVCLGCFAGGKRASPADENGLSAFSRTKRIKIELNRSLDGALAKAGQAASPQQAQQQQQAQQPPTQ
jgi:hypothetical protein